MATQPNQPKFDYPELVVKTIPKTDWIFFTSVGTTTIYKSKEFPHIQRQHIVNSDGTPLKEFFVVVDGRTKRLFATIFFEKTGTSEQHMEHDGMVSYTKKTTTKEGEIVEEWLGKDAESLAYRFTQNGLLSSDTGPAIRIVRPNGLVRTEIWKNGVLERVVISKKNSSAIYVDQHWVDGKCVNQTIDITKRSIIQTKDLAFPVSGRSTFYEEPAKPVPPEDEPTAPVTSDCVFYEETATPVPPAKGEPTVPITTPNSIRDMRIPCVFYEEPAKPIPPEPSEKQEKTFKVTPAAQAREMMKAKREDEMIQKNLDYFELCLRTKQNCPDGENKIHLIVEDEIRERLVKIFEEAGYAVRVGQQLCVSF